MDFATDNGGMDKPLSEDLRKRIVAKRDEGHTTAEVSRMFGVSMRSVDRYCARMRTQGGLSHDKLGKPPGSRLDVHQVEISKWIAKEPGLTLEEIAARCETQLGLSIHHASVMRALAKWGFRYKKRYTPMNSEVFLNYVQKVLAPTLEQGDLVICDNLSSHKSPAVKKALQLVGADITYLPPYSPDMNPIEMVFSKIKAYLRGNPSNCIERITKNLASALDSFNETICTNLLHHAQYKTA